MVESHHLLLLCGTSILRSIKADSWRIAKGRGGCDGGFPARTLNLVLSEGDPAASNRGIGCPAIEPGQRRRRFRITCVGDRAVPPVKVNRPPGRCGQILVGKTGKFNFARSIERIACPGHAQQLPEFGCAHLLEPSLQLVAWLLPGCHAAGGMDLASHQRCVEGFDLGMSIPNTETGRCAIKGDRAKDQCVRLDRSLDLRPCRRSGRPNAGEEAGKQRSLLVRAKDGSLQGGCIEQAKTQSEFGPTRCRGIAWGE
jgi:hypothetical protein